MKTNIKLRVTPEQSKAVQKICFNNKIYWAATGSNFEDDNVRYIFINIDDMGMTLTYESTFFHKHEFEEIDADLFIRTNGTCVESTETLTEECQFAKYGFEKPDFECELWKVETSTSTEFIHGLVLNDYAHPMGNLEYHKWNKKTGEVLVGCSSKNLTPIKKPWYETCKFPCIIRADACTPVVVHYFENGYVYDFRDNKYCVKSWRLLTNDKIEGLKQ